MVNPLWPTPNLLGLTRKNPSGPNMPPGCRLSAISASSQWTQTLQDGIGRGLQGLQLVARVPWNGSSPQGGSIFWIIPCWCVHGAWSSSGILISSVKQPHLEHLVWVFCFGSPWSWSPGGPSLVNRGRSTLWGLGMCLYTCQLVRGDLESNHASGEVVRCWKDVQA